MQTPGEEEKKWEVEENSEELPAGQAKVFRGHAARLNYLATDRPDIQYSTKEICRAMARPTVGAWRKLKRIVRYLVGTRRTVLAYPWQGVEQDITAYSDSDWAGCRSTGRSTSGGVVLIGEHYIKGWSSTQADITLSSAEAEVVAMTKTIAETIGISNMVRDFGYLMRGVVYADSSAALAIANRKGSGRLRHINIRMLWIQEQARKDVVETRKVKGQINPADLMTKYMAGPRSEDLMRRTGQEKRDGRAEAALEVKRNPTDRQEQVRATTTAGQEELARHVGEEARTAASASNGGRMEGHTEVTGREGVYIDARDDLNEEEDAKSDTTHASTPEIMGA